MLRGRRAARGNEYNPDFWFSPLKFGLHNLKLYYLAKPYWYMMGSNGDKEIA